MDGRRGRGFSRVGRGHRQRKPARSPVINPPRKQARVACIVPKLYYRPLLQRCEGVLRGRAEIGSATLVTTSFGRSAGTFPGISYPIPPHIPHHAHTHTQDLRPDHRCRAQYLSSYFPIWILPIWILRSNRTRPRPLLHITPKHVRAPPSQVACGEGIGRGGGSGRGYNRRRNGHRRS